MENEIFLNLFESHSFKEYANATELFVLKYLMKRMNCKVVMYGAGKAGKITLDYLKQVYNIDIDIIIDKSPAEGSLNGIKVMNREEFTNYRKRKTQPFNFCTLISIFAYSCDDQVKKDIESYLIEEKCVKIIDFSSQIGAIIKPDWYDYFISEKQSLCNVMNMLEDEISKETLYEYIAACLEGHMYEGKTYPEVDKYFVINDGADEIIPIDNERWINFGSYSGDTIYNYLEHTNKFEKIFAVEGDYNTASILKNNLSFLPDEISKKIEIINSYFGNEVNQERIDDYFEKEKITYINMDIEGYELDALSSGIEVIKRCRPVLAICGYHKKEDLITIPNFVKEKLSEYLIYVRKYPSLMQDYYEGRFCINELVIYAVPQERIKKRV